MKKNTTSPVLSGNRLPVSARGSMFNLLMILIVTGAFTFSFLKPAQAESASDEAAFQGKVTLARYSVDAAGEREIKSRTPLIVHPDYILLEQSDGSSVDLLGNVQASGIIVRQKQEDFVFLTTDRNAVVMNKQELQQMINMLDSMRGNNNQSRSEADDIKLEPTGEQKELDGYTVKKWKLIPDGGVAEWHIWVTDELVIPWGLLAENWLTRRTLFSGLPVEEWLEEKKLPLQAEFWNGGKLAEVIKIEDIEHESIDQTRFQIPDGYKQINFQQMLFDRMRNR